MTQETIITRTYLRSHKDHIFVFGDNLLRRGKGGAAILRYEPNVYGFITKKAPTYEDSDYYTVDEYRSVFESELKKLIETILRNPYKTFLISRLGGGIANKYQIYEHVIQPGLQVLKKYKNVQFLFT